MKETKKDSKAASANSRKKINVSGDEYAAIAMALHSFFGEMHDDESGKITITHNTNTSSQWCSKILNMRNLR